MSTSRNPIKHINFSESDYFKPTVYPGGNSTPHKNVSNAFRLSLINEIDIINQELSEKLDLFNIGVSTAIVELEEKATAKSNRPTTIFSNDTCPFFGDAGYAKFLIKITSSGLESLRSKIKNATSKAAIKEISAIKSISLYKPQILNNNEDGAISVRLFRFNSDTENLKVDTNFEDYIKSIGCEYNKHSSNIIRLYRITGNTNILLENLPHCTYVQSAMASKCITVKPMAQSDCINEPIIISAPDVDTDYPVVAVVDSGISKVCHSLSPWIIGHSDYIAEPYKNAEHGTFVSGLICNAFQLNGNDPRFPKCQSQIYSIEVLGNDTADMYDIINAMYEVADNNKHIKVWNLSLGSSSPVSMSEISTMALMLDEFQDRKDCLCIVAAGNYEESFRQWPPEAVLNDRISSPGDSVRCLTVGSLAHVDGFVKNEEPSHFSRKGPVSNYVQKPEVVHFGGNIMMIGGQPITLGVNSISSDGYAKHDIGTSFSTPLVSTIAANLFQKLGERATPSLVKALIIHSANLGHKIDDAHKPYYGWGIPETSANILEVHDYESTMVFEGKAQKSFQVEKLPFPIPDCLRTADNKVRAEFFITLVYLPELDPNKAFEYCQMDLQVGFGEIDKNGKFTSRVPLQKGDHKFETDLVKSGDKWSPVKVYQARFSKGVDIENWRLRLKVLDRDGYEAEGVLIPFSIILTVRDLDKEKPVYNEMAQLMDHYNWEVSDLVVDTKIRV